jgi:hypothetical protein
VIRAGIAYGVMVFGLGFALGMHRHGLMGIGLGRSLLVALEIPVMLAYAWWAAGWSAGRFAVSAGTAARLAMGAVMFALLRLGELAVGMAFMGQTASSHAAAVMTPAGLLETAPQVLTALFPWLRARLTGR